MDDLLTPWIGSALRHINARRDHDVLDFRFAGRQIGNRWNTPHQPTLYLAGDPGVLVAEWGRHLGGYGEHITVNRTVFRLHLSLKAVLDLRDREVLRRFGMAETPHWYASKVLAQSTAEHIRKSTRAQAMLVPSIAFLDDLTRWNLVLFLDKLPAATDAWITRVERVGPLSWHPD